LNGEFGILNWQKPVLGVEDFDRLVEAADGQRVDASQEIQDIAMCELEKSDFVEIFVCPGKADQGAGGSKPPAGKKLDKPAEAGSLGREFLKQPASSGLPRFLASGFEPLATPAFKYPFSPRKAGRVRFAWRSLKETGP